MADLLTRKALVLATKQLDQWGLNQGRTGNLSVRSERGCLITPTGMQSDKVAVEDMVALDADGQYAPDQRVPSSEWKFHCDLYSARSDAQAIVHTHSTYATAIACHRKTIPAFHYMIAELGGDSIPCAEYATFGTPDLSKNIIHALQNRRACLMANHGVLTIGDSLDRALHLARLVEELAKQYWLALQIGEPVILSQQEMAKMKEKFKTYGKQNETN